MDRRVFGLETELGVTFRSRGPRAYSGADINRLLQARFVEESPAAASFLVNGGRFYIDGEHPEYSTPECDSLPQLIAHDKAGERIVEGLATAVEAALRARGSHGDIYLFKNNTDSFGNSYGTHENYLVSRELPFGSLVDALIPFLATRHMICGSGKVLVAGGQVQYCFGQRAEHMMESLGQGTLGSRAIISMKDVPYADPHAFRRLHVIVGDASMAEPTTLLKVGATDLVLRMFEEQASLPELRLADPVAALRTVNRDLTGRTRVKLALGGTVPALQVQQEYLAAARTFAQQRGLANDPLFSRVLTLWSAAVQAIAQQDFSGIDRDIDWAIKHSLIERYRSGRSLGFDHPRVSRLDLGYHDISRRRGLYARLEQRGEVNRVVSDLDILKGKVRAPDTTRARLRGQVVRWVPSAATGCRWAGRMWTPAGAPARQWCAPTRWCPTIRGWRLCCADVRSKIGRSKQSV